MSYLSASSKCLRLGFVGLVATATAIACSPASPPASDSEIGEVDAEAPKVVATNSVLCDLTRQIAQETVALTCLLQPGQDPHTYQAKPSDRLAIDEADLILYGGYNFAPSLVGLLEAGQNPAPRVAVYEAAVTTPLMGAEHVHDHGHTHDHAEAPGKAASDSHQHDEAHTHAEGEHDHTHAEGEHDHTHAEGEHDHTHAGGEHDHAHAEEEQTSASSADALVPDPHVWHSAKNNGAIAEVIADNLAKINPDQAETYETRSDELAQQFTTLDSWIQTQVATIPAENRYLVTPHDAFRYFADAYGLEVKGALSGLSTETRPSGRTLTDLVEQVKTAQVPAIFAESTTNPELINAIAQDAAVKVAEQPLFVEGPGTADSNAPTLQAMLVVNTCTIVNALGGTCAEAEAPL